MTLHVAVLMGGWSAEREVSLMSGKGIAEALESLGHRVTRIDMGRDVATKLTEAKPEKEGDAAGWRERLRGYGMTPTEDPEVLWNFEKFLVARDGSVAARFSPAVTPDDPSLVKAIEKELAK